MPTATAALTGMGPSLTSRQLVPSTSGIGAMPNAAGLSSRYGSQAYLMGGLPSNPQFAGPKTATTAFAPQPLPNLRPTTQPLPNMRPQTATMGMAPQQGAASTPPPPPPMPTFGPTGPSYDVSQMSSVDKAAAFAAANPGNPSFVRPTDAQGNFQGDGVVWKDDDQWLPDLGWSDNRYYVPQ
jgi:hypothetical protein